MGPLIDKGLLRAGHFQVLGTLGAPGAQPDRLLPSDPFPRDLGFFSQKGGEKESRARGHKRQSRRIFRRPLVAGLEGAAMRSAKQFAQKAIFQTGEVIDGARRDGSCRSDRRSSLRVDVFHHNKSVFHSITSSGSTFFHASFPIRGSWTSSSPIKQNPTTAWQSWGRFLKLLFSSAHPRRPARNATVLQAHRHGRRRL